MNSKHKKLYSMFLSLGIIMCLFAGCQKNTEVAKITKGDFAEILANEFNYSSIQTGVDEYSDVKADNKHYDAIQACVACNAFVGGGEFGAEQTATMQFAVESAIRAIGVDSISCADSTFSIDKMADYFNSNIAQIDLSGLSKAVTNEEAKQIIQCALDYKRTIELPQVVDIKLAEGVKEDTEINFTGNGTTGEFGQYSQNDYEVGDIIYIPATANNESKAVKVNSVSGADFTYEEISEITDVFEELTVTGTYDGVVIAAEDNYAAIDVAYGESLGQKRASLETQEGLVECGFSAKQKRFDSSGVEYVISDGNGASISAAIENFKVSPNIELKKFVGIPCGVKKADIGINFDTRITCKYEVHEHEASIIPLGKVTIVIPNTPITMELELQLNFGVDGEITLEYKCKNWVNVNYSGNGFSYAVKQYDVKETLEAKVTLTAEASLVARVKIIGLNIANANVTTGIVAIAETKVDLLDDSVPECVDILIYVPLRWGINQEGCLITTINSKWKYSQTIWDSTNSEFKWHYHFENGERVEECTRNKNDEVEASEVDEDGNPFEEYKYFDFEVIEFDLIELKNYNLYLNPGESTKIEFSSIPSGLTESDMEFSSSDKSVCTVDGKGNVTGVGPGSTTVNIVSSDGMYEMSVTITVADDYTVEGFEAL